MCKDTCSCKFSEDFIVLTKEELEENYISKSDYLKVEQRNITMPLENVEEQIKVIRR